jgi:opacity protein-like surface antigen
MKKILLLSIVFSLVITSMASAKFTIRLQGGIAGDAGMPSSGRNISTDMTTNNIVTEDSLLYYSGGNGTKVFLEAAYDVHENIALGFSTGYSAGIEEWIRQGATSEQFSTGYVPLNLNIMMKTELGSWVPYIGFGPTLAVAGASIKKSKSGSLVEVKSEEEITYKPSFGFNAILGTDYMFTETIGINVGLKIEQISLKPGKGKLTSYSEDGVDKLGDLDVEDKEFEYVENTVDSSHTKDMPGLKHAPPLVSNAFVIQVGLTLNF